MRVESCAWWCGGAVLLFLVIYAPTASDGAGLSDAWSDFDRTVSIFDPIGDYVSQPIEKAVLP